MAFLLLLIYFLDSKLRIIRPSGCGSRVAALQGITRQLTFQRLACYNCHVVKFHIFGMSSLLSIGYSRRLGCAAQVADWAVRQAVTKGAAPYRTLWGQPPRGPSPAEALAAAAAGDARFDAALKLAAPPLLQHLRATPLGGWSDGDARALAALSLPAELLAALRAGGCLGAAQLAGPEGLLSWPPLGYELSQPSGQFAPARLLSWACQAGCPAAATFVIELAQVSAAPKPPT